MAFRQRPPIGGLLATPIGRNWCSLSSAIAAVAGSFFSEKYSETPLAVREISCDEYALLLLTSFHEGVPAMKVGYSCLRYLSAATVSLLLIMTLPSSSSSAALCDHNSQ